MTAAVVLTAALVVGPAIGRADQPRVIAHAGDGSGRLFVGERAGRILVLEPGAGDAKPYLDLADDTAARSGGLLGIAFPHDFVDKRRVYVSRIDRSGSFVVARFRLAGTGAAPDRASEEVLLRVELPGKARPGGGLAFGPDGRLYVGVGEGIAARKSRGAAQDRAVLPGKILRLDIDAPGIPYAAPRDNPWINSPAARPELWAVGVGNPAWLGFDASTGDLVVTDTLGDKAEEIVIQPGTSLGGENYGWPYLEGPDCRGSGPCTSAGFTHPAVTLRHAEACEIAGAAVLEKPGPAGADGRTFVADRCSGRVWTIAVADDGAWTHVPALETGRRIAALGAGDDGGIYIADERTGTIHRLAATAAEPPR